MKTMENTHPVAQVLMWFYGAICLYVSWDLIDVAMKIITFCLGTVSVSCVIIINAPKVPQAWAENKKMLKKLFKK